MVRFPEIVPLGAIAGFTLILSLLVVMTLYTHGRRQIGSDLLLVGIFLGMSAGFLTDFIVSFGGA